MRNGDQNSKRPQISGKLYLLDIPLVLSRGQTKITDTTGGTLIMIFNSVSSNSVNFLDSYDNLIMLQIIGLSVLVITLQITLLTVSD